MIDNIRVPEPEQADNPFELITAEHDKEQDRDSDEKANEEDTDHTDKLQNNENYPEKSEIPEDLPDQESPSNLPEKMSDEGPEKIPENGEMSEKTATSEKMTTSEKPETPENTETPENSATPETAATPEKVSAASSPLPEKSILDSLEEADDQEDSKIDAQQNG